MREIKFRAWDKKEKKICNESLIIGDVGIGEGSVVVTEDVEKGNELIWMQFTGLKDKNGKEIYEGDILRFEGSHSEIQVDEIAFKDGSFDFNKGCVIWVEHPTYIEEGEVIGNKFENPELLK